MWDAVQWLASPGIRKADWKGFPLSFWLASDVIEDEPTDVEQAAWDVAANSLRNLCRAGIVRCGFIEEGWNEEAPWERRARLLDKEEFADTEVLWDGTLCNRSGFDFGSDVFVIYEDLAQFMGLNSSDTSLIQAGPVQMVDFDRPRRGRTAQFDEREFWALVTCMADLDQLPESQAEFVRRIDQMLIDENRPQPGETWLKKRATVLYRVRSQFRK